jgi:hypothetical protein
MFLVVILSTQDPTKPLLALIILQVYIATKTDLQERSLTAGFVPLATISTNLIPQVFLCFYSIIRDNGLTTELPPRCNI